MNPQQSQSPHQARADQAAASLGLATNLSQMLMPKAEQQPPQASQKSQNAPKQEQKTEPTKDTPQKDEGARIAELELSITKKLDDIRKELKADAKTQVDSLKKDIEKVLQDEQTG